MKIEPEKVSVGDLVKGYRDDGEGGVVGYDGKLDIRPPYQREFVYKEKQRNEVIRTLRKNFPLNVMYWATRDDGQFEIIDGQQRTISIAQYVASNRFSVDDNYYHNLKDEEKKQILSYPLTVYICTGEAREKLDWFEIVNIAGERLTRQELLNASYTGSWLVDAKNYFSKTGCVAQKLGGDYVSGSAIRQEYLETAIRWISDGDIKDYMGLHQHDADAKPLWEHFKSVIRWVEATFPQKRKDLMKGLDWGEFYKKYKDKKLDPVKTEERIAELIEDKDVQSQRGIYLYILSGEEKHLNLRTFTQSTKQRIYQKQNGKCNLCKKDFAIGKMEADHINLWSEGGKTEDDNCQMLCKECHRKRTDMQLISR